MKLHEITRLDDPSLPKVLQVYEGAFPVQERMMLTTWAEMFKNWYHVDVTPTRLPHRRRILLSIQDDTDNRPVGMALCHLVDMTSGQRAGYLGYFAIAPENRGGTGSEAYPLLMDWFLNSKNCETVIFQAETDEAGDIAVRRLNWYKRLGAHQLGGVEHQLQLPDQPPVPLHVMAHFYKPHSYKDILAISQVVLKQPDDAPEHETLLPITVKGELCFI